MLEIGIAPEKIVDGLPPGATDGVLRLLYVGRFLYLKGVHLGIQAMGQLVARGIQVELTMVGKGPEEAAWRSEAERRGVADRIRWVPWVRHDELPAVYAAHDILLFPSLRDSSGNVVLEALACGCPVVCVDLGGPPEILAGQPCGTVVGVQGRDEDQLAAALADALGELATDRKRLADMRVAALARAREMTWRAVVARLWGNDSPFLAGISRPPEQRPDVSGGTGGDIATR